MASSLLDFLRAMGARWFTLMSGGFSVPFAILGVILGDKWQGTLFWILGLFCFASATYFTWKAERERAERLQARLTPRFDVGFEPDADGLHSGGFRERTAPGAPEASNRPAIFIRGHVVSLSDERLSDCRATISQLSVFEADQWREITQAPLQCKWAHTLQFEAAATIQPKGKAWFDIAFVAQGLDKLYPHTESTPHGVQDQLRENRRYLFRITVDAQGAPARYLDLEIDWKTGLNVSAKKISK